jgi:Fe-S cluster assembly ATPase SufC
MSKRRTIPPGEFRKLLQQKMKLLKVDNSFINRSINDGFSGGEKKRAEILQMALLEPTMAILDETELGTRLMLPPHLESEREAIAASLAPLTVPAWVAPV